MFGVVYLHICVCACACVYAVSIASTVQIKPAVLSTVIIQEYMSSFIHCVDFISTVRFHELEHITMLFVSQALIGYHSS